MQHSQSRTHPITLVISEIVAPDRIDEYEDWARGINRATSQAEGFLGVEVIRPRDHDYPEYVIIVRFDTYKNLRCWLKSSTYAEWMQRSRHLIATRSYQLADGMELWFDLPNAATAKPSEPAYYKKVILGVLAVYPLILLANALLGPLLGGFHPLLSLLISVFLVSALLTYPVMPWLTRLLRFWLYPGASKRSR